MPATVIVAHNQDQLIAVKDCGTWSLPWPSLKEDRAHLISAINDPKYRHLLVGYQSCIDMTRLLSKVSDRVRVILDADRELPKDLVDRFAWCTMDSALDMARSSQCLVLGGERIYQRFLLSGCVSDISITRVDTHWPRAIQSGDFRSFSLTEALLTTMASSGTVQQYSCTDHKYRTRGIAYQICQYSVIDPERFSAEIDKAGTVPLEQPWMTTPPSDWEGQYRDLVKKIWDSGHLVQSRSGNTRSLFGAQLRCDLSREYPIVTSKQGYPITIFEELLWMIRGHTDAQQLRNKGVTIWDGHSSQEFLASRGLSWRADDIGPGYGFQMRHAGAKYSGCDGDYTGQGVDQLAECVRLLKEDPSSRRIIVNLWNVSQISEMSLPPCHMVYQWGTQLYDQPSATGKIGKLNCHLFQRSWDIMLGWNPATAALLTHLLAATCNYDVGELVHSISDVHIYQDHSDGVAEMLSRPLYASPRLEVVRARDELSDYVATDTVVHDYYPMPSIRMKMAI